MHGVTTCVWQSVCRARVCLSVMQRRPQKRRNVAIWAQGLRARVVPASRVSTILGGVFLASGRIANPQPSRVRVCTHPSVSYTCWSRGAYGGISRPVCPLNPLWRSVPCGTASSASKDSLRPPAIRHRRSCSKGQGGGAAQPLTFNRLGGGPRFG